MHGHAHPAILAAIGEAARNGWTFGAPTEGEAALAEEVNRRMPSVERLRFVTSGTEATMSALRVARAATGRSAFLKFAGAYHGHSDPFLSKAGSGMATFGSPDSAGVPAHVAADARTVPYNDLEAAEAAFRREGKHIAAVFVEPVAANMGLVPPAPEFLSGLRDLCDQYEALLIFDEVITGFRVARGGAQELFRVQPDLTTLGKVLGGGMPLAAYGGRSDLMSLVAPDGPVYQAGTLAGNPLAVAAGQATLDLLPASAYDELDGIASTLQAGLTSALDGRAFIARIGSLLGIHFGRALPRNWTEVEALDGAAYARLFHALLASGVYLAPSPFEAAFVSLSHSQHDVECTVAAVRASVETMQVAA
ncbi:MAG: glutamate-1-semialdehyde 2,1-aminomutase [Halobacteriales archaeon]|nr:glutamate-1-semialdehyde 2,1-aminomutase [Halobacteriales archaeon]